MISRRTCTDKAFMDIEYFPGEREMLFEWLTESNVRIISTSRGSHMTQKDDGILIKFLDKEAEADFILRFT